MAIRNRILGLVSALATLSVVQGCDVAATVVAAPFIIGADAIVDTVAVRSAIVQPVEVLDRSGNILAGPTGADTPPKHRMQFTGATISCSGASTSPGTFALRCDNGWRTNVTAKARGTGAFDALNRVGSDIAFAFDRGRETGTVCRGAFIAPAPDKGPFQIACSDFRTEWADFNQTRKTQVKTGTRSGVVAISRSASGRAQINIWIGHLS